MRSFFFFECTTGWILLIYFSSFFASSWLVWRKEAEKGSEASVKGSSFVAKLVCLERGKVVTTIMMTGCLYVSLLFSMGAYVGLHEIGHDSRESLSRFCFSLLISCSSKGSCSRFPTKKLNFLFASLRIAAQHSIVSEYYKTSSTAKQNTTAEVFFFFAHVCFS